MAILGRPKWLKAGFQGFSGTGKTYTAINLALGLHERIGSKRPIQVYDSEGGFEYQANRIKEICGIPPEGVCSQSFVDLIRWTKMVQEGDIAIVDSVTHPWRELLEARQNVIGRFRGIMLAIEEWRAGFSTWYLSSPAHVIICGRGGYIFAEEIDEHGEMKLTTKGTKMKTESELGFEPSLLVEMEREERRDGTLERVALVKKDRFGIIDGRRYTNPTFASFHEFVDRLNLTTGGPPTLDVTPRTAAETDPNGKSARQRELAERDIILEEIKNDLTAALPGQTAVEKAARIMVMRECFDGVSSWLALEKGYKKFPVSVLREGRERLRLRLEALHNVEGEV